eukprot:1019135-Pleurochrysis_carterae.AAC.2
MKKLMTISTLMGQFYAQQRAAQQWLEGQGIEAALAAKYIGAIYHCISYDSRNPSAHTFDELVSEQTAGGLNEQVAVPLADSTSPRFCSCLAMPGVSSTLVSCSSMTPLLNVNGPSMQHDPMKMSTSAACSTPNALADSKLHFRDSYRHYYRD